MINNDNVIHDFNPSCRLLFVSIHLWHMLCFEKESTNVDLSAGNERQMPSGKCRGILGESLE